MTVIRMLFFRAEVTILNIPGQSGGSQFFDNYVWSLLSTPSSVSFDRVIISDVRRYLFLKDHLNVMVVHIWAQTSETEFPPVTSIQDIPQKCFTAFLTAQIC